MPFSTRKNYAYHPIKHPPPEIQECFLQPSSSSSDKPRRSTSKSPQSLLFFLIVVLLSMYIVLSVLLPEKNSWFTIISTVPLSGSSRVVPSDIGEPSNILISLPEGQQDNKLNQINLTDNVTLLAGNTTSAQVPPTNLSVTDKIACVIPKLDPFDKTIKHLTKAPEFVNCSAEKKFPLLFDSFENSTIVPYPDQIRAQGYSSCCFRKIERDNEDSNPDDDYKKSKECYPMSVTNVTIVKNDTEFIAIYCRFLNESDAGVATTTTPKPLKNGTIILHDDSEVLLHENDHIVDMHVVVRLKPEVEKRVENFYENLIKAMVKAGKVVKKRVKVTKRKKGKRRKSRDVDVENEIANSFTRAPGRKVEGLRGRMERERVNVVILGIDAVSHMNFLRVMPNVRKYLMNDLDAVEMQAFNKMGDNTYPNMAAALTSYNLTQMESCSKDRAFDSCPFIWKDYASQGYRTSYGEDSTWMGIFNYLKRGFEIAPTDYYLRPFGEAADELIGTNKRINAKICQGPRLSFENLLNYMKKLAFTMNHTRRYFQLIWATSLTHDFLNDGHMGDIPLLHFFQWMNTNGYLNDTVFILMSDHGIRWGEIRDYLQGQLEERLPFLYFILPQWFKKRYSRAFHNMKINRGRLTTHYDLHETLVDLLNLGSLTDKSLEKREEALKAQSNLSRGLSQFLPIPKYRTCEMAGIVEHYCTCHQTKVLNLPPNEKDFPPIVEQAANFIIYSINLQISTKGDHCAYLSLERVKRAMQFGLEFDKNKKGNGLSVGYQLVLETSPGGGVFEGSVQKDKKGFWQVSGTISRINLYGNQSHCVTDKVLKLYCYCLDLLKSSTTNKTR